MTITLSKNDIIFLVKNETFLTGESLKEKDETLATKIQAQEEDMDSMEQYLMEGVSRITDILSESLAKKSSSDIVYSDSVPFDISFELNVPMYYDRLNDTKADNFDYNQLTGLREGIKGYLVNYVLYRWYSNVFPDKATYHCRLLDNDELIIRHRLHGRIRKITRRYNAFGI